jgi:hypothetical protein
MIYNDRVAFEYGSSNSVLGNPPVAYQPKPTGNDYGRGFFTRWFAKRVNGTKAVEIDPEARGQINTDLYAIVSVTWKIAGPQNNWIVNGIIEKSGVEKENLNELERAKHETGVDLATTLTNPLELWRGY